MKRFSLRYSLLTSRMDQLWFPLAFWALFIVIGVLRGPQHMADTTRSYLGAALPLVGGIMAAYAVLEDPALELRFATPISSAQTLLERLGPTFAIQILCALTYQVFAWLMRTDLSILGGPLDVQLAWLVPALALMALGCMSALAGAQTIVGAVLVGLTWLVELVARGWFAGQRVWQYLLIFMSPLMPDHPALRLNQLSLVLVAIGFFVLSWRLFERQERYL